MQGMTPLPEVVVTRLDVGLEALPALAALLSESERQRASRFAFDGDRRRFTVARARLRQLLAARLGARPESIELACGPHGKPRLSGRFADSDLRFNVAHSGDIAVYAFSRGREVGVDVEAVRAIPDVDAVAARFFSRRENEAYRALASGDRAFGFFNCWTRKEAFVKALGNGLRHPPDSFDVSLAPGEPARILRIGNEPGRYCRWRMAGFVPLPGYVAAAVIEATVGETGSRYGSTRSERLAVA
jgi:4'-phosphopantetheinyl transferase